MRVVTHGLEIASACANQISNVNSQRMSVAVVVSPRAGPICRFLPPLERVRLFDFLRRRFLTLARIGHDGLERELWSFNRLRGGVCTTCAPGDQEKSSDIQRERVFRSGRGGRGAPLRRPRIRAATPTALVRSVMQRP